jgi:hypothetical protein
MLNTYTAIKKIADQPLIKAESVLLPDHSAR